MNPTPTFESIVRNAFASIIQRYGYHVVDADDSNVRLDSVDSTIIVRYDRRRSFEVGVDLSELENGQPKRRIPFSLAEVFREFSVPNANRIGFLQSSDLASVHEFLVNAAENLERFCGSILRGESNAFSSVNERRTRESVAYTQQVQIKSLRPKADKAWREKRYQEFVDLLVEFKTDLPIADQKKLDYAMKALAKC
jgi:hypothetical protein